MKMMQTLPGYDLIQILYESDNSLIYRAHRTSDTQPVILKLIKDAYPSPERIAWLKHEYTIMHTLSMVEGVPEVYSIENEHSQWMMVMHDSGGESLRQLGVAGTLSLDTSLTMAIAITNILGNIHQHHIIHKDINPGNIVYNPHTHQLHVIDFGIATALSREQRTIGNPRTLEGTLAYISPEQTGRMNRAIDYRTDFYSLGATLYELLVGVLPFDTDDLMELVHSHIARPPTPPHELRPDIPPILSRIILKLMAKNAEDRYQSAHGLKADLEECLRQWQTQGKIEIFTTGRYDIPDKFQIPQKLYGRDQEIESLLTAFDRVSDGAAEMMLISGPAGIGKTVLVQELYKPVTRQRGYFISGTFDQYERSMPYQGIIQALRSMIRQILTQSEARIAMWRERLLAALGSNAPMMVALIPELEVILGPQPTSTMPGASEAQYRFLMVFQQCIQVFTSPEHPLVIFLDDLQWADDSSLTLMEALMTSPDNHDLFLIGAFRDNESDSVNPLRLMLKVMHTGSTRVHHLTLESLELPIVTRIISDTLHCTTQQARPLAAVVLEKTGGNPFFVNEFLQTLFNDSLIWFDYDQGGWQWDITAIRSHSITDNVVSLMTGKIKKLDHTTQAMLKLAACIGQEFDLTTLSAISDKTSDHVASELEPAVQAGMLIMSESNHPVMVCDISGAGGEPMAESSGRLYNATYTFAHNHIQQAVHSMIADEERQHVHWRVGHMLLQNMSPEEREERIFAIVTQLNQGRAFANTPEQCNELAALNMQAARKAMDTAAYNAALTYLRTAAELLDDDGWQTAYELTLAVHRDYGRCFALNGQQAEAEQCFAHALEQAASNIDKAEIYNTRMVLYSAQGMLEEVIETGRTALSLLGISIPLTPDEADIERERHQIEARMAGQRIADLINLPQLINREKIAIMRILMDMLVTVWWTRNQELLHFCTLKMINLSLQYGNADSSTFGYVWYGMILGSMCGRYETAHEFGMLGLRLADDYGATHQVPKLNCIFGVFVDPWRNHIQNSLEYLQKGYEVGVEIGDLFWAGLNAYTLVYSRLIKGDELERLYRASQPYLDFARRTNQPIPTSMIILSRQFIASLRGMTVTPGSFSDEHYNEEEHVRDIQASGVLRPLYWYYKLKLQALYLFEQYEEAYAVAVESDRLIEGGASAGVVTLPEHYLYYSLTLAALYPAAPPQKQEQYRDILHRNNEKLHTWAHHCPDNFRHKYLLVEAEIARLDGQDEAAERGYTQAITSAGDNGYIQNEALAHELAARFYLGRGFESHALTHVIEARNGYLKWGAHARVHALDATYANLLAEAHQLASAANLKLSTTSTTSTTTTSRTSTTTTSPTGMTTTGSTSRSLDLATVMKASQALSSEVVLESLLSRMIHIVIENAGAQRGVLILERNKQWVVEAEGSIDTSDVTVLQAIPFEQHSLPLAVINYVLRTSEHVVLGNAVEEGDFTHDEYIKANYTRSILCSPLITKGTLTGVLYLENSAASGTFTPDRLEMLNLMSGQVVISLENAMLYATMEQKIRHRTEQLAKANKEIVTLYERLKMENMRLEAELDITRTMQQMLLPRDEELCQVAGLDIAGFMEPAEKIGGDYYDVLQHAGRVKIGIGDVTGHGLQSGVLMLMVQTAVRTLLTSEETDVVHFFNVLNRTIYNNTQRMQSDKSLTLALIDYDRERGELRLSGQHEYIIVVRQHGKLDLIDTLDLGFPIGLDEDISPFVAELSIRLQPGDGIVLYTDGITEAENESGEQYGLERLCEVIQAHWAASATEIKDAVIHHVKEHIGAQQIYDDLTLLVMKQQ